MTRDLCSLSGFGIAVAKTEKPIRICRSMNSVMTHENTGQKKELLTTEMIKSLNSKESVAVAESFSAPVQLTRTSTSAKLNVLLDAASPLPSYIFVSETISDADAGMLHIPSIMNWDTVGRFLGSQMLSNQPAYDNVRLVHVNTDNELVSKKTVHRLIYWV